MTQNNIQVAQTMNETFNGVFMREDVTQPPPKPDNLFQDSLNYTTVLLTSITSKLLEGIIQEVIVNHLIENKLISDAQHGFRSKQSCLTSMFCYLDHLINTVDKVQCVDINYLRPSSSPKAAHQARGNRHRG